MSKGEREFTSKLNERILQTGGERNHMPQMLGVQEERSHMSLRGERHVYVIDLICFALILFPYFLPLSNIRFRGRKTAREESL